MIYPLPLFLAYGQALLEYGTCATPARRKALLAAAEPALRLKATCAWPVIIDAANATVRAIVEAGPEGDRLTDLRQVAATLGLAMLREQRRQVEANRRRAR